MSAARESPHPPTSGASANILGRWLHFGIATCIVLCLVLASIASRLNAGGTALGGTVAFNLHKFIGLNALLLVLLFLVWSALGHARTPGELFPWVSPSRLWTILRELKSLDTRMHIPATAAAVQGCGIVTALAATVSGVALVLISLAHDAARSPAPANAALAAIHAKANAILWGYLALHVCAALLHSARGQGQRLSRMFRLLSPD